jgi:outer membrane protein assembly factor BamD
MGRRAVLSPGSTCLREHCDAWLCLPTILPLGERHSLRYDPAMLTKTMTRIGAATAPVLLAALALSGCATSKNKADTEYVARDVSTLYNAGKYRLDRGQYKLAAALFDEVERQHPYSPWARRAQLMSAFSYYMNRDFNEAIGASQRFLSIHTGNKDAPYAYYLIALCYYEQIADVTRDQKITQQSLDALGELIRRYPDTGYAADARLKLDLVNDHLAGKEMEVGRFYQRRSSTNIKRPPTRPKRWNVWSKAICRSASWKKRRRRRRYWVAITPVRNGISVPTNSCRNMGRRPEAFPFPSLLPQGLGVRSGLGEYAAPRLRSPCRRREGEGLARC